MAFPGGFSRASAAHGTGRVWSASILVAQFPQPLNRVAWSAPSYIFRPRLLRRELSNTPRAIESPSASLGASAPIVAAKLLRHWSLPAYVAPSRRTSETRFGSKYLVTLLSIPSAH